MVLQYRDGQLRWSNSVWRLVENMQGRQFSYFHGLLFILLIVTGAYIYADSNKLSEESYQQLAKVHEFMEQKNYDQALRELDTLDHNIQKDKYTKAIILQTYAYLYSRMEKNNLARNAAKESLTLESLPKEAEHELLYLSAQLHVKQDDYAGALPYLTEWFAKENSPKQDAHMLAAVMYTKLGNTSAAIGHLERALNTETGTKEILFRQLIALYLHVKRKKDAIALLKQLINEYGEKADDWWQLSAVYRDMGDESTALAVLILAKQRGVLQSESDLLTLVNYYLYLDLPYDAATLLDNALQHRQVTETVEYWELLADAWSRAWEPSKALSAINRAVLLTDEPKLQLKRARIALIVEDWTQVLQAVDDSLNHLSVGQNGEAYLLAGIAHYHRDELSKARQAMQMAKLDSSTVTQADQWLELLKR